MFTNCWVGGEVLGEYMEGFRGHGLVHVGVYVGLPPELVLDHVACDGSSGAGVGRGSLPQGLGAHAVSGHPSVSTDSAECVVQVLAVGWVEEGLVRSVLWSVVVEVSHHGGHFTWACRK